MLLFVCGLFIGEGDELIFIKKLDKKISIHVSKVYIQAQNYCFFIAGTLGSFDFQFL